MSGGPGRSFEDFKKSFGRNILNIFRNNLFT